MSKQDRTKKWIMNSYLELANIMPLRKITIQKLCEHAEIHRSTFYYHFNSVQDLINWIYHVDVNLPVQEFIPKHPDQQDEITITALNGIYKRAFFWQRALKLQTSDELIDFILKDTRKNWEALFHAVLSQAGLTLKDLSDEQQQAIDYVTEYYCNAHFRVTLLWMKRGMKIQPEKFAEIIDSIATNGYFGSIDDILK